MPKTVKTSNKTKEKPEETKKTDKKVEKPQKPVAEEKVKNDKKSEVVAKKETSKNAIAIGVLGCVAVLALVILCGLLLSGAVGGKTLPKISVGDNESEWQKDGQSIQASEEISTTCAIENRNLGSDLRPTVGESASSSTTGAGKYGAYSSLECVAKINGTYDDYKKGAKLVLGTNEGDFTLKDNHDNTFELTHTYRVFANLTGAPSSTPYKVSLLMEDNDGKVLSEYNLTIKVALSDDDKKFIAEWKNKIDQAIAKKEQEEKEKAEREAAATEAALDNAITPNYTDLFRNYSSYRGKYVRITGRIVQTDSSNSYCRVATKVYRSSASTYAAKYRYSSDDVIYVSPCNPSTKLLEDDVISVVGEANGNYTYTTVMGASLEIPRVKGMRFWLLDHID